VAARRELVLGRWARLCAAVGLGGVGACLYLALTFGSPGALLIVYMTQLPLFAAGLWLGTAAAIVAGLTGIAVLAASGDPLAALVFAAMNALPAMLLVRQALLTRRRPDGAVKWYPPGLLAGWLTALALVGIGGAVVLSGGPQGMEAALRGVAGQALDRLAGKNLPNRDQIAATLGVVMPGIIAAGWMSMTIVNAVLAQGIVARLGAARRPSPDLAELGLPLWVPLALGAAAGATLLGGAPRFVGISVMIALCVPLCLGGLAVLHAAVRRLPNPGIVLIGFYLMAAVFGWPLLIAAVFGLLENWLGLRHRLAPHGVGNDG
jgi:hypothetical protein